MALSKSPQGVNLTKEYHEKVLDLTGMDFSSENGEYGDDGFTASDQAITFLGHHPTLYVRRP